MANKRKEYYSSIQPLNAWETTGLIEAGAALLLDSAAAIVNWAAAAQKIEPQDVVGTVGPYNFAGKSGGGQQVGSASDSWAQGLRTVAGIISQGASISNTVASYERRGEEWEFQVDLAGLESLQIDEQIQGAQLRVDLATLELKNHQTQIEQAREIDEFQRSKFSNLDLYNFMVTQTSTLYFQGYQMAYDLARRAEQAFRLELALDDSNFIQFGYWDSLRKGLLAGERLRYDLRRMEAAYLERNIREYEILKHISLLSLDPMALVRLRQTGQCFIQLPEAIFDRDYPGHYQRRIKSVSLSVPCVTGPYVGVNATLTLQTSSIRRTNVLSGGKHARIFPVDNRFQDDLPGVQQSIATSNGQADSGLFETNLQDERFLPFENAGAISTWHLELSPIPQFEYQSISDVVMHLRYTAREGGLLKAAATTELQDALNSLALADAGKGLGSLFSLKHRFSTEWFKFLGAAASGSGDHIQKFTISRGEFPYYLQGKTIKINRVGVIALPQSTSLAPFDLFLTSPGAVLDNVKDKISLMADPTLNNTLSGWKSYPVGQEKGQGDWTVTILAADFPPLVKTLDDLIVLCEYTFSV